MSAAPEVLSGDVAVLAGKQLQAVATINREHRLACSSRDQAVQHGIRCGQLLLAQKEALPHGRFMEWIAINCDFEQSTATRYMAAAKQFATGIAISSMTAVFPSGRRKLDSLPAPNAVQTLAPEPPAVAPTVNRPGAEISIEQAIAALEADGTTDSRRRLKELARAREGAKEARRRLERLEIRERNAEASALAAAQMLLGGA